MSRRPHRVTSGQDSAGNRCKIKDSDQNSMSSKNDVTAQDWLQKKVQWFKKIVWQKRSLHLDFNVLSATTRGHLSTKHSVMDIQVDPHKNKLVIPIHYTPQKNKNKKQQQQCKNNTKICGAKKVRISAKAVLYDLNLVYSKLNQKIYIYPMVSQLPPGLKLTLMLYARIFSPYWHTFHTIHSCLPPSIFKYNFQALGQDLQLWIRRFWPTIPVHAAYLK